MKNADIKSVLQALNYDTDRFGRRLPYKVALYDGSDFIGAYARSISTKDGNYDEICFKMLDDPNLWLDDEDYLPGKMRCLKPDEISAIELWKG